MRLKGSFTVEASLVMPAVLFTVISLVMLAMGLRDRVYVSAWIRASADTAAVSEADPGSPELLISAGELSSETAGGGRVLSYSGSAGRIWPGGSVSYSDTAAGRDPDQPGFMYICRLAESLIG